ncbi:uncharacterized protein C8R40DRAFT_768969 [Lentinula edodes]|nr:uncharacterized protein C8R40DRAFT_768969 [Lentinula edodes]KAH7878502.1 hypothetical protein C8R40DRAFT_768969 [Lentinula edodes]
MTPPAEFSSPAGSLVNQVLPNGAPALEHAEMRKRTYHDHANLDTAGLETVHGGAASRLPNSEEHQLPINHLLGEFPVGNFGVISHMTANRSEYLSRPQDDYVSDHYDTENPIFNHNVICSSGQSSNPENNHPIASTIGATYRAPATDFFQVTMNTGTPHNSNIYGYMHTSAVHDLHFIDPSQDLERMPHHLSPSQLMSGEYPYPDHELRLPPVSPRLDANDFTPSSTIYSEPPIASGFFLPDAYAPSSLTSNDVIGAQPQWGAQSFVGDSGGMGHASGTQDISVGYPRLQDRRSMNSFYQRNTRLMANPALNPPPPRRETPKKQTLACHFCRERKIACSKPDPGSPTMSCNQCSRRNLPCTYPTESRRGQHKRNPQRMRDLKLLL